MTIICYSLIVNYTVPIFVIGHNLNTDFPTISFSSIKPIDLLSLDIGRLSPKTRYLPSGILLQVHISSKLKSLVFKCV